MYGTIEQASRRWRGGGRDAKLIAARRRLAEIYDREDHERDVEAGVPVAVAAIVNAPVAAEELLGQTSPARFFVRSAPVGESATARNATSRGVSDRSPSTRVDAAATRAASIGLSAVLLLAVILVRRTRCSLIVVRQRV